MTIDTKPGITGMDHQKDTKGNTFYNLVVSALLFGFSSHIVNAYVQTMNAPCDKPLGLFMLSAGIFGYILCTVFVIRMLMALSDSVTHYEKPKPALPSDMVYHTSFHGKKKKPTTEESFLGSCGGRGKTNSGRSSSKSKTSNDSSSFSTHATLPYHTYQFSGSSNSNSSSNSSSNSAGNTSSSSSCSSNSSSSSSSSSSSNTRSDILIPAVASDNRRTCGFGLSERSALLTSSDTDDVDRRERTCGIPWPVPDDDEEEEQEATHPAARLYDSVDTTTYVALMSIGLVVTGWLYVGQYWLNESKVCDPSVIDSSLLLITCGRCMPVLLFVVLIFSKSPAPAKAEFSVLQENEPVIDAIPAPSPFVL